MAILFAAGQKIRASDLNFIVPGFVKKPSNQSLPSNTTLQNDTALLLPVLANASYAIEAVIIFEAGTTGDAKFAFSWPASSTFPWGLTAYGTGGPGAGSVGGSIFSAAFGTPTSGSSFFAVGGAGAGNQNLCIMKGTITTTASAGNVQVMWAENTSDATPTIVSAGSTLRADRVA